MRNIEPVRVSREQIARHANPVELRPGIYRWWFEREEALKLLKAFPELDTSKLHVREIEGKTRCCLYFGISKDLAGRVEWHVRQQHTPSAVRSGFLSTLRQTLSALLEVDMSCSEERVNACMDACYWEWEYTDTEAAAREREREALHQSTFCYPLNLQGNKTIPASWWKRLSGLRKKYKK